jgi:putative nucleotidyltransferase-like protein
LPLGPSLDWRQPCSDCGARCKRDVNKVPSPEYALLLDAIVPLSSSRVAAHALGTREWQQTLHVADWHRLQPALYCHVRSDPAVPTEPLAALEQSYLANAARSMFMTAELGRVLEALSAGGTEAMLLKGAALVRGGYIDPPQREMLDLDILVRHDQIEAGNAALAALGYVPDVDGEEGPKHLRLDQHHDAPLISPEQVTAVELHRHLTIAGEGNRFDIDEVWDRSRPDPNSAAMLPAPEDLLLHLCLHFTRNRLGGSFRRRQTGGALAQISDIARTVGRDRIDWSALIASARRYKLDTRVFLALFAARELGVAIPSEALADLRPTGFESRVGRRLVAFRVLQADDRLPVRSMRWIVAPSREVLVRGWGADPAATTSLARAYLRRARAFAPLARSALRRPWAVVQDRRLNGEIYALEDRG